MELPQVRKKLGNFVFQGRKTQGTLLSGLGNSNLLVREKSGNSILRLLEVLNYLKLSSDVGDGRLYCGP